MDTSRTVITPETTWEQAVDLAFRDALRSPALRGAVLADADGFLLAASPGCHEAERLAALAPMSAHGALTSPRQREAATLTVPFHAGDHDFYLGLVGEAEVCEVMSARLTPHLIAAMAR